MERIRPKKLVLVSMLLGLLAFVGGCHDLSDEHGGYGAGYGSYRDGFRDGRVYERRNYDRYARYRDYYRNRW